MKSIRIMVWSKNSETEIHISRQIKFNQHYFIKGYTNTLFRKDSFCFFKYCIKIYSCAYLDIELVFMVFTLPEGYQFEMSLLFRI